MTKNKTATTMAILLTLTFAISIVAMPASADLNTPYVSTGKCTTYPFIGATPNPVGVGQDVLLHVGITQQLSLVQYGWEGLTVTVTKPDGTTATLGPFKTDSTGGTGAVYKPDVVGNYTLQTHFPEQRMPSSVAGGGFNYFGVPVNTTMLASDSAKLTLVVQQDPIQYYPGVPLPTGYWTRPINAQLREWYSVSGSSWMSNEYNDAPESPHVLWTKPLTTGGLVGGMMGELGSGATSVAMENGDAYEGKWGQLLFGGGNPIILAGKLYYQTGSYDRPRLIFCVDLRTGEELWHRTFLNNQSLTFGQLFYWESYNYQGTFAYLWVTSGTTWTAFDPFTGEYMASITNVPSGTRIEGPRGEIYLYSVNLARGWMALWNMSAFVSMAGSFGSAFADREFNATSGATRSLGADGSFGSWSTSGGAARLARAWAWNITIPTGLTGSISAINWTDGRVVGYSLSAKDLNIWAFCIPPIGRESPAPNPAPAGAPGTLLYNNHWAPPADWANQTITWTSPDLTSNIGFAWSKESRQTFAFDLKTGQYLWTTEPEHYLNVYGMGKRVYNGKLYSTGMAGIVYCYDITTGKTLWTYDTEDPYQAEVLWSDNWPESIYFAEGGKLYLFHLEHSANQPLPRGAPALCLNATTGDVIWRVNGLLRTTTWGGGPTLGDSVIAMYNTYDQLIYAVGKGPSAMTVAAPDMGVPFGSSVTIKGTVTDVSPGTKQTGVTLRFPNGVPAVSDESQGEWMKYVYAQFPSPTYATGVDVTLSVLDSNNNYREIGTAKSNSDGFFTFSWTPDIEGQYTVYASFAGSGSYYPSHAVDSFTVDPAPQEEAPAEVPPDMTGTYVTNATIAIIVAVAIVGAILALLLLRKRP
jgi:outer membrane protein assembly factor BamB